MLHGHGAPIAALAQYEPNTACNVPLARHQRWQILGKLLGGAMACDLVDAQVTAGYRMQHWQACYNTLPIQSIQHGRVTPKPAQRAQPTDTHLCAA
jgi:hypothetical protein